MLQPTSHHASSETVNPPAADRGSAARSARHPEDALRLLPAQLGYTDASTLIAALEDTFGLTLEDRAASATQPTAIAARSRPAPSTAPRPSAEAMIRAVVNRRLGPVQSLAPEARRREIAERETMAGTIHRLFRIGLARTPSRFQHEVRESDVEWVATILRRLALIHGRPLDELVEHVTTKAANDASPATHIADPFQIRHVLSFSQGIPSTWLDASQIARLQSALERRDHEAVRRWFADVTATTDLLPKETPSFLKNLLLQHCTAGHCDLATLAFEQAVLSVRLHGVIGWENTRTFYALLKRLTGSRSTVFDGYLTGAEIESAVHLHEETGDQDELVHFLRLRTKRDPLALANLERTVGATAQARDEAAAARPPVTRETEFPLRRERAPGFLRVFQAA